MNTWFLMQKIENAHVHAWIEPMRNVGLLNSQTDLGQPTNSILSFNDGVCELHFDSVSFKQRGILALSKLQSDSLWISRLISEQKNKIKVLHDVALSLSQNEILTGSNKKICEGVRLFFKSFKECHLSGLPIVLMESNGELYSNYLKNMIESAINRNTKDKKELPFFFTILTTPNIASERMKEKSKIYEIYNIATQNRRFVNKIKETENIQASELLDGFPEIKESLSRHANEFGWLPYMYSGPGWGADHFFHELVSMIHNKIIYRNIQDQLEETRENRLSIEAKLCFSENEKLVFNQARELMYLKDQRKDTTYFAFAKTEPFWKEVTERIGLPIQYSRMLLPEEIIDILDRGIQAPSESEIEDRLDCSLIQFKNNTEKLFLGKKAAMKLAQILSQEEKLDLSLKIIVGSIACPGEATGKVCIINKYEDGEKMVEGDILVSVATDPSLEPLMQKAAAIITDMGGLTCHAAIMSRELGLPCIVGTRYASKILKNDELVKVDANKGTVERLI